MNKNKVLLTGATGFIGSHLAKKIVDDGFELKCLIRNKNKIGNLKNLPIEIIYGDLSDKNSFKDSVKNVDYIIHNAGLIAANNKNDFYKINTIATKLFIEEVLKSNPQIKKFVYISSLSAIGPSKKNHIADENSFANPITNYGKSKLESEKIINSYKDKLPITIIRPSAVYGEGDFATLDFFKMINFGFTPILGNKNNIVNFINVHDLVNGILLAMKSEKAIGETFFICSEKNLSWEEIFEECKIIFNRNFMKIKIPKYIIFLAGTFLQIISWIQRKPRVLNIEKTLELTAQNWSCTSRKAQKLLGYKEIFGISNGFKSTLDWYKNNNWL